MAAFNRGTGLLIIEVKHSNPNGDPDMESEPRTLEMDGRGLISPVSFKRKLRDLVGEKEGPVWAAARDTLKLHGNIGFDILESRGRDRKAIAAMSPDDFKTKYWDGRVFGATFLEESRKNEANESDPKLKSAKREKSPRAANFIVTGTVQFGPGVSIAPIDIDRLTTTNKAGVEGDKDRGLAPLGWRVVRHGVYAMPFYVNAAAATKSGCAREDIALLQFVVPQAYRHTASAVRPSVEIRHAWYAEHRTPLGSCPDSAIIDALMPRLRDGKSKPVGYGDYDVPSDLGPTLESRLQSFEDLAAKSWG